MSLTKITWEEFDTLEELEELIPIAEKQWIESEGELPDYYVSPLK